MRKALIPFPVLSSLGHACNDLYFVALPMALPLILREFSLSYRMAGLILATFLGIIAVCSLLFGRLSDRFSPWIVIGGGFLLASAAFLGGGLAGSLPVLFALLVAGAVGTSTFHPVAYALIGILSGERQGRMLGIFELWGGFAILVIYILGGLVLQSLGWQGILVLVGIPGLALGPIYLRRAALAEGRIPPTANSSSSREPAIHETRFAPVLVFFLGSCVLRYLSVTAVVNFLPTYLAQERGFAPSLAAYVTAFLFIGGTATSLFWGRAADRFAPLPVLLIASAALAPLIFAFSLEIPLGAALPILVFFGAFQSGCSPAQNLLLSIIGARFGRGAIFGILMGLIGLIGALSPALFGLLADQVGLRHTMRIFALPVLASWLLLVAFARTPRVRRLLAGVIPSARG